MLKKIKSTNIHGVSDLLSAESKTIAAIWFLVIILAAGFTIQESVKLIQQYRSDNIASKISLKSPERLPMITICPEIWFDVKKLKRFNVTESDLKFILSLTSHLRTDSQTCFVERERIDINRYVESFKQRHGSSEHEKIRELMMKIAIDLPIVQPLPKLEKKSIDDTSSDEAAPPPKSCSSDNSENDGSKLLEIDNNNYEIKDFKNGVIQFEKGQTVEAIGEKSETTLKYQQNEVVDLKPTQSLKPPGVVNQQTELVTSFIPNLAPQAVTNQASTMDENWKYFDNNRYRKKMTINNFGICFSIEFLTDVVSAKPNTEIISYASSESPIFNSYKPEYDILFLGNIGIAKSLLSIFEKIPLAASKKVSLHQTVHAKLQSSNGCSNNDKKDYTDCLSRCIEKKCFSKYNCTFIYKSQNGGNGTNLKTKDSNLCSLLPGAIQCNPMVVSGECIGEKFKNCEMPCKHYYYDVQVKDCSLCLKGVEKGSTLEIEFKDPRNNMFVEEFQTFTWQTLVSSLGGTLSLFFGASVLSLVQMIILACRSNDSKRQTADSEAQLSNQKL